MLRFAGARALTALQWTYAAALTALVVHGLASTIGAVRRSGPGRFTGAMASTDHMLAFLAVPQPSEAVRAALRGAPESEAVLFVGRANTPAFAMTYYGVTSAALPRPVADLRCHDSGEARLPHHDPGAPYGAVILYEPAGAVEDARSVEVGARLTVIHGRPRPDLASYCSAVVPPPPPRVPAAP